MKYKAYTKCKECKKEFVPYSSQQLYCSVKCRRKYKAKMKSKNIVFDDTFCKECDTIFTPKRRRQKFCSATCGKKYWAKQNKKPKIEKFNIPEYYLVRGLDASSDRTGAWLNSE